MKHFTFQRKLIHITSLIQHCNSELSSNNVNFQSLQHFLKENRNKLDELNSFVRVYESLFGDLTRSLLQMNRLIEENHWLKDELQDLRKKITNIDKSISKNNIVLIKLKYLYEMRLNANISIRIPNSENTYFDLLEIEADDNELKYRNSNLISNRVRCLSEIIKEYVCQGQYEVAISLCKQSIDDIKLVKEDHSDVALLLCMLGFLYKDLRQWNDAANCIYEALKIREKNYGSETSIVASTLNNLAIILTANNNYFEAENLCRKALEIREKLFGSKHESVAKQMNNLGLLLINIGLYSEGECLFHKALNIYSNLNNSEIYYLKTSTNLANLFLKRGQYTKAELQLKHNLKTIYKHRFKNIKEINIIKIYEDYIQSKFDNIVQTCMIADQYFVAEIVNIKMMIKLFEMENKIHTALKLKKSLNTLAQNSVDYQDETKLLK